MKVCDSFDCFLVDLDGTVYEGGRPIPGAVEALNQLSQPVFYVTNNASRHPDEVAKSLRSMGLRAASSAAVMTSAMAAIEVLRQTVSPGQPVLVVGTQTLVAQVREAGFQPTRTADDKPAAVIHGHNPETGWQMLSEAALAIRSGARYIATNTDATLPAERGLMVGNGSMVMAVVHATQVEPISAGKPEPTMFLQIQKQQGSSRPLCIGDRLDTDIAGGNRADHTTLHVLTGVSGPQALVTAEPIQRPALLAATLEDLQLDEQVLQPGPSGGLCATRSEKNPHIALLSGGEPDSELIHAVRTVCALSWDGGPQIEQVVGASPQADRLVAAWW